MTREVEGANAETTGRRWLSIVGIGEDGLEGLSAAARQLVVTAELVVGGARHLQLAGALIRGERLAWPSPITDAFPEILRRRGRPVVVLATGDPFHYGIGGQLARLVPVDEFRCLPHASAFALAAARLGWSQQDVALVSLHGRSLERVIRHLQPGARVLALSWDERTPSALAALLAERGMGASRLTVLEALGGPRERVTQATAATFVCTEIDPLNTVAVEVVAGRDATVVALTPGRDDALFDHDGQITKRAIRSVVLGSLGPRRGELLWDIGLGSGAVAIEWLLADPSLTAFGVEARPDRAARAQRNASRLGATGLQIVEGRAPQVLAGLPRPDAIFVGGGLTEPGLFETAWAGLKPGGRLVCNAVTLETEALLLDLYGRHGGELLRIDTARAEAIGPRQGWRPAMPITHWRVVKS